MMKNEVRKYTEHDPAASAKLSSCTAVRQVFIHVLAATFRDPCREHLAEVTGAAL